MASGSMEDNEMVLKYVGEKAVQVYRTSNGAPVFAARCKHGSKVPQTPVRSEA